MNRLMSMVTFFELLLTIPCSVSGFASTAEGRGSLLDPGAALYCDS